MNEISKNLWAVVLFWLRRVEFFYSILIAFGCAVLLYFAFLFTLAEGLVAAAVASPLILALLSGEAFSLASLIIRANACGERLRQKASEESTE